MIRMALVFVIGLLIAAVSSGAAAHFFRHAVTPEQRYQAARGA